MVAGQPNRLKGIAIGLGGANFVRKDPAVVKAAMQAAADVRQSLRSISELTAEASAAWYRSARTR